MWHLTVTIIALCLGQIIYIVIRRKLKLSIYNLSSKKPKNHYFVPITFLLPTLYLSIILPSIPLSEEMFLISKRLISITFISLVSWLSISTVLIFRDLIFTKFDINVSDNLKARAIHTQVNIFTKIILIIISLLAAASIMMVFENIRQLGTSIIASAGILSIIFGLAAQKSIATLIAGLQIAITQPIRIDDVVIVEGEWGKIEEISLTYVVVRIWDLRRLVVPTNYFLEKPFQNWTRVSADLLATLTLHADYTLPVDVIREQLYEILKESPYWDEKVWKLHVTDTTNKTVELRALMSASDSSNAWELKCEVREKLLKFFQENYPGSLPRIRAELIDVKSGVTLP